MFQCILAGTVWFGAVLESKPLNSGNHRIQVTKQYVLIRLISPNDDWRSGDDLGVVRLNTDGNFQARTIVLRDSDLHGLFEGHKEEKRTNATKFLVIDVDDENMPLKKLTNALNKLRQSVPRGVSAVIFVRMSGLKGPRGK